MMSMTWGNNIEITLFGESHGEAIGVVIGNLPAGLKLDMSDIEFQMSRRVPGRSILSTTRKEKDQVRIVSGILNGITTGAPLCGLIVNEDQKSKDYSLLEQCMRPGHCDYPAFVKYNGFHDIRGSGHFSGRLTAPLVFAGSIARQILKQKGIEIGAHIMSIKDCYDDMFSMSLTSNQLKDLQHQDFPLLNKNLEKQMKDIILHAKTQQDSVGGMIECAICNVPAGIGNPFFDSIESHLSSLLFSVPSVKSIGFGLGEKMSELYGSKSNDSYYYDTNHKVHTKTNNNGGITGGISNGMPIVFHVGIKPTPTIGKEQSTINVKAKENIKIQMKGRHDPCIVYRAVVVIESVAALGMLDLLKNDERFRTM